MNEDCVSGLCSAQHTCINIQNDPYNCGAIANNCFEKQFVLNATCVNSNCVVLQCSGQQYADCNNDGNDGCEVHDCVSACCSDGCSEVAFNAGFACLSSSMCMSGICDESVCAQSAANVCCSLNSDCTSQRCTAQHVCGE